MRRLAMATAGAVLAPAAVLGRGKPTELGIARFRIGPFRKLGTAPDGRAIGKVTIFFDLSD